MFLRDTCHIFCDHFPVHFVKLSGFYVIIVTFLRDHLYVIL